MMIYIYQDYVHNNGALQRMLCDFYGVEVVRYVDARDVLEGCLTPSVKAFFMPGGASRYVADKLDGEGNQRIKDYVAKGGLYVGICAGAYYACRRTEWNKGQKDEIITGNELAFFPGDAIGPIENFVNGDDMARIVRIENETGESYPVFYWGGPLFHAGTNDDYHIFARYADVPAQPPAIVAGQYGTGRYLLFSHHPEIDSTQLDLMRFDVISNRHADISSLENPNFTAKSFSFVKDFIEKK